MYCSETEILTRQGFKKISIIDNNAKILTKNPLSGKSTWALSKGIEVSKYTGDIHFFKTRYWESPRFTPYTNMWATTIKQSMGGVDSILSSYLHQKKN